MFFSACRYWLRAVFFRATKTHHKISIRQAYTRTFSEKITNFALAKPLSACARLLSVCVCFCPGFCKRKLT
nr:MAG TPA: Papillomavirus E5A protein [Caudoviricetes sp.]